jgi:hypothetical protein
VAGVNKVTIINMRFRLLPMIVFVCGVVPVTAQEGKAPAAAEESAEKAGKAEGKEGEGDDPVVPDDLLEDEHMREEYGVNQFTTPSIRKIFGQLDKLGGLPYEKLRREIPKAISTDRTRVALALGLLIGDGFLSVQTEKVDDLETVGRAVLRHAKVLSAGARVTEHAKSLLENGALGDWKGLRDDLAATQKDTGQGGEKGDGHHSSGRRQLCCVSGQGHKVGQLPLIQGQACHEMHQMDAKPTSPLRRRPPSRPRLWPSGCRAGRPAAGHNTGADSGVFGFDQCINNRLVSGWLAGPIRDR